MPSSTLTVSAAPASTAAPAIEQAVGGGEALPAGDRTRGAGVEAAGVHRHRQPGAAPDRADQQRERGRDEEPQLGHRVAAGVHAAGPAGHADHLPLLPEQRHQPERGQRADGEPGRRLRVLHQRVGQVGGVGGGEDDHAGQRHREHPQHQAERGDQHAGGDQRPARASTSTRAGPVGGEEHQRDQRCRRRRASSGQARRASAR